MLKLFRFPAVNSSRAPICKLTEAMHSTAACQQAGSQLGYTTGSDSQTASGNVGCLRQERPPNMQL